MDNEEKYIKISIDDFIKKYIKETSPKEVIYDNINYYNIDGRGTYIDKNNGYLKTKFQNKFNDNWLLMREENLYIPKDEFYE